MPKKKKLYLLDEQQILDLAIEAHTQGRIYSLGGEIEKPGDEYTRLVDFIKRVLKPYEKGTQT